MSIVSTTLTYDALNRKTQMADPDMGVWNYGYDANGNLTSQTDARGYALTFSYDALNRLTGKFWGATQLAWYLYDAWWDGTPKPNLKGRRTLAVAYLNGAWNNSHTYEFDGRGRVLTDTLAIDTTNFATGYRFDSADRVTQMTYPTGERLVTSYTPAGNPSQMYSLDWYTSGTSTSYVSGASYNALGQPKQTTFGNNSREQYDYYGLDILNSWWSGSSNTNPYGSLWRKLVWSATNVSLLDMQHGYDPVGNVTARFVSNNWGASWEGTRYSYDHLDRLTSATSWPGYTGDSDSIGYNAIGNITSKAGVGSYDYATWGGCSGYRPHAVRYITATVGSGVVNKGYCYDANGNMQWRMESGHLWLQSWDTDNRLVGVQKKSLVDWVTNIGAATTFYYDADGQRVKKTDASGTTLYFGDYAELIPSIKWTQYYAFNGQRIAVRNNIAATAGSVSWLHGDMLGSASMTTDALAPRTATYGAWMNLCRAMACWDAARYGCEPKRGRSLRKRK